MTSLTIGIPTYQRRDAVVKTVSSLLDGLLPANVNILVIDDGSSDGTFEALNELASSRALRVLRNDHNLQFVGNFGRLFEECTSDYLLVTSDEDEVLVANLAGLVDVCHRSHPLVVSPQALIDGRVYRGRTVRRTIRAVEWRSASNYISGLTFRVESSRPLVRDITALASTNGMAEVYPQVLLTAQLLLRGDGLWLDAPLTVKREDLPTHITDRKHGRYFTLPGRWEHYKEIESYLATMAAVSGSADQADKANEMLAGQPAILYGMIRQAIAEERPDLMAAFDAGARRNTLPRAARLALKGLQNPRQTVFVARERFTRKRR